MRTILIRPHDLSGGAEIAGKGLPTWVAYLTAGPRQGETHRLARVDMEGVATNLQET